MRRATTTRSHRRGAFVVEAAMVISSLLIFMFAIFEYGRFTMLRHAMDNATREGARLAVAANASDTNSFNYQTTTTIQAKVDNSMGNLVSTLTGKTIQVYLADASGNDIGTWTSAKVGQNVAVQFDATYTPMLPTFGFLPSSVPITAKVVMRTDAN